MKVEKEGVSQLTLKQSFFGYYVMGLVFILVGGLFLYFGLTNLFSGGDVVEILILLVLGLLFLLGGIFFFSNGGKRYLDFDKNAGKLNIDNQTIRNKSKEVYDLSKVSKLVVTRALERSNSRKGNSSTRVVNYFTLQFSDGNTIELEKRRQRNFGIIGAIKETTSGSSLPDYIEKIVDLTGVEVEHVNNSFGGSMLRRFFKR